jgi:hypothetical protein
MPLPGPWHGGRGAGGGPNLNAASSPSEWAVEAVDKMVLCTVYDWAAVHPCSCV